MTILRKRSRTRPWISREQAALEATAHRRPVGDLTNDAARLPRRDMPWSPDVGPITRRSGRRISGCRWDETYT